MNNCKFFLIGSNQTGQRIDVFLAKQEPALSRSQIKQIILSKQVKINEAIVKPHHLTRIGDRVQLIIPAAKEIQVTPEAIPLEIIYEDNYIIVINKTANMVAHPAPGNYSATLVNALLAHCGKLSDIGAPLRPGIVHRLDKDTSGLLVAAKCDLAHHNLTAQLAKREIQRTYWALVQGTPALKGEIDIPIGRHVVNRKKISVISRHPKPARTAYTLLESFNSASLLQLKLYTGRTHQIRVHLSHIGHPILGDKVYKGAGKLDIKIGKQKKTLLFKRQLLHAKKLGFKRPCKDEYLEFEVPLPADMQTALDMLRESSKIN